MQTRGPFLALAVPFLVLGLATPARGDVGLAFTIDCSRGMSLAKAAALVLPNTVLTVKGTCAGPVTLTASGVQLVGGGGAAIQGGGQDAVTVRGAQRVTLTGLTITGGLNGVVVEGGAEVTLRNDAVTGNLVSGVVVQGHSSATLDGGSSSANGLHGVDVESSSALTVTGAYAASGNLVFGVQVNNGSSLTLNAASVTVAGNTLGVQLGTNASAFMAAPSQLDASGNGTVGLTLVSGAHMVAFGGTITASRNGVHGLSLNSKAGLELDAAAQVTATANRQDGVHLEQGSELTVFNNPLFSQARGASQVTAVQNGASGLALLTGSRVLVDNVAQLVSQLNGQGVSVDDGSAISFGRTMDTPGVSSVLTRNGVDAQLTFGSRLTYLDSTEIGVVRCDATVLVRGPRNISCPH